MISNSENAMHPVMDAQWSCDEKREYLEKWLIEKMKTGVLYLRAEEDTTDDEYIEKYGTDLLESIREAYGYVSDVDDNGSVIYWFVYEHITHIIDRYNKDAQNKKIMYFYSECGTCTVSIVASSDLEAFISSAYACAYTDELCSIEWDEDHPLRDMYLSIHNKVDELAYASHSKRILEKAMELEWTLMQSWPGFAAKEANEHAKLSISKLLNEANLHF